MKKLIVFLTGVLLIALMFAAVVLTGAIYETSAKTTVETFFFQPNEFAYQRQGAPKALHDLSADELRNMLLNKYITEYFYVMPNVEEVAQRMNNRSALARMSDKKVFTYWMENVAPEIEKMAQKNMLRTASLISVEPQAGSDNYWRVEYELKTWSHSNDLSLSPVVTRGVMYMQIIFRPGIRELFRQDNAAADYLEAGGDPAALFMFGIRDITIQE